MAPFLPKQTDLLNNSFFLDFAQHFISSNNIVISWDFIMQDFVGKINQQFICLLNSIIYTLSAF